MPECSTIDIIFIVRQLQKKFYGAHKTLYMAFVDLAKALDRVTRREIWRALHKLSVDKHVCECQKQAGWQDLCFSMYCMHYHI